MKKIKRRLALLFHEPGPVCFACGRWSATPCRGHEYGGTITQWRIRTWAHRWVPTGVYSWIDPRWTSR